jgi:hypothetical protein
MISELAKTREIANRQSVFSPDRKYRYTLWREWSAQELMLTAAPEVVCRPDAYIQFIGLNPSKADEIKTDNTLTRCIDFAKRFGFGALCMTNLFAWRETAADEMKRASDPIGPDNDEWLETIAKYAQTIVCCWGNHGDHLDRASQLLQRPLFKSLHGDLRAFGLGKTRQPKHPLMLARLTQLLPLRQLESEFDRAQR